MSATPPLAIFAWFGIYVPFPERMTMIKDAGFDATSLWWEEADERRRNLRHRMPEIVRDAGLAIDHIHVPFLCSNDLWTDSDRCREDAVHIHTAWLRDCAEHDVDCMVMHVTRAASPPPPTQEGIDSLRRIVDEGENYGVTVAIENTRSNAHIDALLEAIDSPRLGLCYDSSHDHLYCPDAPALWERRQDRVVTTHFCDTDGKRDQHWLPGAGVIDFKEAYGGSVATDADYRILLEVVPAERETIAEAFLAEAHAAGRELCKSLASEV
jgi:sugar phosphate isomerase/epimerase